LNVNKLYEIVRTDGGFIGFEQYQLDARRTPQFTSQLRHNFTGP
jgi:hypothetical protein